MKEYLKMESGFSGRVGFHVDELWLDSGWCGKMDSQHKAMLAAHAINSHDELVDSLQSVTKERDELAKEFERIRVQAKRYEFIRNCTAIQSGSLVERGYIVGFGALDAMIDEMMKGA